jgi:heme O synthase-like polyprenyltransferase
MIISVTVPEAVIRAAQDRNMPVEDFVDMLIDKGMEKATGRPIVSSAIERIRALRTEIVVPKR